MDSLKLEIYLLALSKIKSGEHAYACVALKEASWEVLGQDYNVPLREEIFTEFFDLYDQTFHSLRGEWDFADTAANGGPWWEAGHHGRIRTLRLAIERVR